MITEARKQELISGGDAPIRWALRQTEQLDSEAVGEALGLAGRVYGPEMLLTLWVRKAITPDVVAAHVGLAWSAAEFPQNALVRSTG